MNALYLIDFSNFAYKFKSVYKFARVSINGVPVDTSVLFGIKRACKENIATDIAIVLDGLPKKALSVLPAYKGTRNKDEISTIGVSKLEVVQFMSQLGMILDKNIYVICSPLQETDQVIGSLTRAITHNLPPRANFISKLNTHSLSEDPILSYIDGSLVPFDYTKYDSVIISSTDGDFIQLQRFPNVYIDTTCTGKAITDNRSSKSTSGTTPIASIAYKSIYGDMADNIPSLKISYKTEEVIKVLNEYITSEEALENFKNAVLGSVIIEKLPTPLQKIAKEIIRTDQAKVFDLNWTVAYLAFESFPQMIQFNNDYSIHDSLTKYKIS